MVAQTMLVTNKINRSLPKKIGFDDSFDVTKCLQQIEIPDLLHMCAPCSELPSNISTMLMVDCKLALVGFFITIFFEGKNQRF